VALYRDFEQRVEEGQETLELAPHGAHERNVEALLGRFADASWAYRFGPPAQDAIVASLERDGEDGVELLSQCVRFPAGRSTAIHRSVGLGLEARAERLDATVMRLTVSSRKLAYGVRLHVPGFAADDDAFTVEPGGERVVLLRARESGADFAGGAITALNLEGRVHVAPEDAA
jgi:beta-mannosidase